MPSFLVFPETMKAPCRREASGEHPEKWSRCFYASFASGQQSWSLSESIGTNSSSQSELWEEMSGAAEAWEVVAEMWGLVTCGGGLKCSGQ